MMQGTSLRQNTMRPILMLSALVAVIASVLLTAPVARAQTLTTLYSFCTHRTCISGEPPTSLIQATDGNFYGTATQGGANDNAYCSGVVPGRGCGTVFKIAPSGTLTTLYSFCREANCTDGALPQAGVIQAANGDFYGTTAYGGTNGGGTVFKITLRGKITTLYNFCSQANCTDGSQPQAGLMQASNGDFYGTTTVGGANNNSGCAISDPAGCGTVFKITPTGTLTTMYSFCSLPNCADGAVPGSALVQATNGDLYGTTQTSGDDIQLPGGTVFKITLGGKLTTLYGFSCSEPTCADGARPIAPLMQAANGNLYGSTIYPIGAGTIFEITPSGTLTTIYNFNDNPSNVDGDGNPQGALIQGTDGNFYGVAGDGGYWGGGAVFEITPSGTLTTLYSFCEDESCTDGAYPNVLIQATNGAFFGTTASGLTNGTVFRLNTGLGPFVAPRTTSGEVGASVTILGTDLTGASSVTFNGTAASFAVNATGSAIVATVPHGATTGTVQVVTPNGTLNSNVAYRVR